MYVDVMNTALTKEENWNSTRRRKYKSVYKLSEMLCFILEAEGEAWYGCGVVCR